MKAGNGLTKQVARSSAFEQEMSAEFFGAAALWAWSFLLLVVLLFLNLVLAIILDIYNETREKSFPGEAIWETIGHFMMKGYMFRSWVPDRALEAKLEEASDQGMVDTTTLEEHFPGIPDVQKKALFKACRAEMRWESGKDLQKQTLLSVLVRRPSVAMIGHGHSFWQPGRPNVWQARLCCEACMHCSLSERSGRRLRSDLHKLPSSCQSAP